MVEDVKKGSLKLATDPEVILRERASVVVVHNDKILAFLAEDPTSKKMYYFLPGGAIESGETAPEAAERETLEETGYLVNIDPQNCVDKDYLFFWNGQQYLSQTLFYFGTLNSPLQVNSQIQDAPYHRGVVWLPISEIKQHFGYSNEILSAIEQVIKQQASGVASG